MRRRQRPPLGRNNCAYSGIDPAVGGRGTWPGSAQPRERELVTLAAQGRTDAQLASQLYISVHTVSSHLDRIRGNDKDT
ncbi:MAG TPA: helix-turn-helix transcriptional regulator [Streptosporangiaceae bacterium]|nr:helix-turn-helix transcriptional regulator [Streptosporangiaceae bacterium]